MLRQVLTYNFSNDDTRASFEELLDTLNFVKAEDQSTYVLDLDISTTSSIVRNLIIQWSIRKDIIIEKEDFVQIFFNTIFSRDDRRIAAIGTKYLSYDKTTRGLK